MQISIPKVPSLVIKLLFILRIIQNGRFFNITVGADGNHSALES